MTTPENGGLLRRTLFAVWPRNTAKRAARELGVSPDTVKDWLAERSGPRDERSALERALSRLERRQDELQRLREDVKERIHGLEAARSSRLHRDRAGRRALPALALGPALYSPR